MLLLFLEYHRALFLPSSFSDLYYHISLPGDHVSLHGDRVSLYGDRVSLRGDHMQL